VRGALCCDAPFKPQLFEKRFSVLVLLVAVLLKPASAAVREDLAVDQASLDALMAGRSICGDSSRAPEACLDALPCDALDELIECADGTDPVWTPRKGGSYGGVAAFRAVFPVKAYDHQTAGTLKGARAWLVSTPAFFKLPRAAAAYQKPSKEHKEHCAARFCRVPPKLRAQYDDTVQRPSGCTQRPSGCIQRRRHRRCRRAQPSSLRVAWRAARWARVQRSPVRSSITTIP
jgi:hypothetical protein